jgi:glycosyltransferase involved in cell wall biosynthesis
MIRRADTTALLDLGSSRGAAPWPPPSRANVLALLPAHNEQATVKAVLEGVLRHVERALVVDDGSEDATGEEAARLPRVEVLRIPRSGKGGALRAGFGRALERGYAWVLTLDSDGQHDPGEIPRFLGAAREGAPPLVVGSRRGDLADMPWLRRATNLLMSWLVSRLARQEIPDSQNGFRLISTQVLREVPLTTSHFETESELLLGASRRGFRVGSVPVRTIYRAGGRSHIRKVPDTWRFLRLCVRRPWLSANGGALGCRASFDPERIEPGEPPP